MKKAGKLFFLMIIIMTGLLRINYLAGPVDRYAAYPVELKIDSGISSRQIGEKLYQEGLIRSKFLFDFLIKAGGFDSCLKAGYYELKSSYNLKEIIFCLVEGRIATFKVTIPEGFTVEEIAERLANLTGYSKKSFLSAAKSQFSEPFLPVSSLDEKYTIEGFLYPSTYIIPKEYSVEKIFIVMLNEFKSRWWNELQQSSNYSPIELITIASLIEEEAKIPEEKPLIAAVIYNRLEKGMLLQLDASVQYSLPARKERILYRDLQVDSSYNTYRYKGLPPGPVCNPGDDSIEAALHPADVDYLFYFAQNDGSHHFSKTYQEHISLLRKLRVNSNE